MRQYNPKSNLNPEISKISSFRYRDDLHLWLTPFTPGGSHFVKITFEKPVTIAMLRIWVSSRFTIFVLELTCINFVIFACQNCNGGWCISRYGSEMELEI